MTEKLVLIKMILKNILGEKIHYPTDEFMIYYNTNQNGILMKILNKQTKYKYY